MKSHFMPNLWNFVKDDMWFDPLQIIKVYNACSMGYKCLNKNCINIIHWPACESFEVSISCNTSILWMCNRFKISVINKVFNLLFFCVKGPISGCPGFSAHKESLLAGWQCLYSPQRNCHDCSEWLPHKTVQSPCGK